MRRERVSEDIYIFTSDLYAQVTASAILTPEGAVVIDTLPFPAESREMAQFVQRRHPRGARYVINTHFHADHVYGNCFFPEAKIIGHRLCREALTALSPDQLERAKADNPQLAGVRIVPPSIVFENEMGLFLGGRLMRLIHLPGHSPDGCGVLVDGDQILFSGDAVMPVPFFAGGDHRTLRRTLQRIKELAPDTIVQGHGDTLLRGEIQETLDLHISYLDCVEEKVTALVEEGGDSSSLRDIEIEECGMSPIPLDGLVRSLHQANLQTLHNNMVG